MKRKQARKKKEKRVRCPLRIAFTVGSFQSLKASSYKLTKIRDGYVTDCRGDDQYCIHSLLWMSFLLLRW